jgi:hypothetical protein
MDTSKRPRPKHVSRALAHSISALFNIYQEECEKSRHQDRLLFQIRLTTPTAAIALMSLALNTKTYLLLPLITLMVLLMGLIDLQHTGFSNLFVKRTIELEKILEAYLDRFVLDNLLTLHVVNPYRYSEISRGWIQKVPWRLVNKVPIAVYTLLGILPIYLYYLSLIRKI